MKRILFIVIFLALYAGSLLWKAKQVEIARKREIPTMYQFRDKNGTPVKLAKVKSEPLVSYVTVTGKTQANGLVLAHVAPEIALQIRLGAQVQMQLEGKRINGIVESITRKASLLSGLHELRLHFKSRLKANDRIVAQVETKRINGATLVSREAIATRGGKPHAYIVEDNKVERRDVKILASNNDFYAIKSGLHPGDVVVVSDQRYLINGENIMAVE